MRRTLRCTVSEIVRGSTATAVTVIGATGRVVLPTRVVIAAVFRVPWVLAGTALRLPKVAQTKASFERTAVTTVPALQVSASARTAAQVWKAVRSRTVVRTESINRAVARPSAVVTASQVWAAVRSRTVVRAESTDRAVARPSAVVTAAQVCTAERDKMAVRAVAMPSAVMIAV